ncbi:MAG: right-handed parallel beta-helix repeat-containing protein [Bacteroidetes bacterium]|nr:right-handed parallel beta-helix repeat-containing protein [Bacteroidota bacterium]
MKVNYIKAVNFIAACLCFTSAGATNYYFSTSAGNDTRTAAQASSSLTPWQSINKLNTFFSSLQPGDSVLFNRGEIFYGAIIVNKSGSASQPIVIGAYGTGAKPVITGLTTLASWVSVGGGIYQSSCPACSVNDNVLVMNGVQQAIGRYPNAGYFTYQSHSDNTSVTSSSISGSPNWTGAEVVIRKNHWILDRNVITSNSGSTISFTAASSDSPTDGYGLFIQNNLNTLDTLGEWYFDPVGKNMDVFFGTNNPASYTVQTSTLAVLVTISGHNYVSFNNISFNGANSSAFKISSSQNIQIQNCDIDLSGTDAIDGSSCTNFSFQNSTINHTLNDAINLDGGCAGASIKNNVIRNTGMIPGMGKSGTGTYEAITSFGSNSTIQFNEIDSTAYDGIYFGGSGVTVANNLINYFCLIKDDGGGIYAGDISATVRNVTGNIILNGLGAGSGTNSTFLPVEGIYMDDSSTNYNVSNNTVANCADGGIKVHNASSVTIEYNDLYGNGTQVIMSHDNVAPNSPIRNVVFDNNILFSSAPGQFALSLSTIANDIQNFGTFSNNFYCRPFDDVVTIFTQYVDNTGTLIIQPYDLDSWKLASGQDQTSGKSPIRIPPFTVNSAMGPNQDSNGAFNTGISGLHAYSTLNDCVVSWNSGGELDGGALQVLSPNASGVVINVGSVSSANRYILSFSAIANGTDIMDAFLRQTTSSYLPLSPSDYFKIGTARGEYQMLFSYPVSEPSSSIIFESHNKNITYWLDNVQLYSANVTPAEPNQYFLFAYNYSNATKSVALSQIYLDAMGNAYNSSLTLKPYSSIVLITKGQSDIVKGRKSSNPAIVIDMTPVVY